MNQHSNPDHGTTGDVRRDPIDTAHWQSRLDELAEKYAVPGAVLGILQLHEDGEPEVVVAAHGVLNKNTGVETTTDSVFQIGSMGKVWTATVAMQLVDEGLIDLDAPVKDVLPELDLADPETTEKVTLRHLLIHTSGIDGDDFTDTGRGDDCLEKYVAHLHEVGQNHPLGATWSYCNAGFVLTGRIIEKLTGTTWDQAIQDRIVKRLGLTHTVTLPEDALLHRTAVGHVDDGEGGSTVAPEWMLPRSLGPAGLVSCTAADVLTFVRSHLSGGTGAGGASLLSSASVEAMTEHQVDLPDKDTLGDSWGIGWIRFGWDGHRLVGHDGNTIGQASFLRVLPEAGLAVVLLTNGGGTLDLYQALYREVFGELAGVSLPSPLMPPDVAPEIDLQRHVGVYERIGTRMEVTANASTLALTATPTGAAADIAAESALQIELHPLDEAGNHFVTQMPGIQMWLSVIFYELPTGERYIHLGARATPKRS
jgi:CubicO group peptidase (beta-lactamase class C family)